MRIGRHLVHENLVRLAEGADLLIHGALYLPGVDQLVAGNPRLKEHLIRSHASTEQVGLVAGRAGVKKLVLSHLVPAFPTIADEMWLRDIRKNFTGEAVVGRDLQEVDCPLWAGCGHSREVGRPTPPVDRQR